MQNLSTGTWASIGENCPLQCGVDGSNLLHLVIGEEEQSVELTFDAEGLRKLAEVSSKAMTEVDALFEWEDAERETGASTVLTACGERSA